MVRLVGVDFQRFDENWWSWADRLSDEPQMFSSDSVQRDLWGAAYLLKSNQAENFTDSHSWRSVSAKSDSSGYLWFMKIAYSLTLKKSTYTF